MKRLQLLLLWVWMVCFSAASHDYMFKHLEVKDGLSNNQVNAIYKDSNGFMWFGTASGLNRYDGYNIKIYRSQKDDEKSLPDSYVEDIQEDTSGNLWIRTGGGYAIYNSASDVFDRNVEAWMWNIGLTGNPSLIYIDKEKTFWIYINGKGVYSYREEQKNAVNEDARKQWDKIARQTRMEKESRGDETEDGEEILAVQLKAEKSRQSYADFLRKFSVLREELHADPDEFDLNYYTYGLRLYGNMPLIEPVESREVKKIQEFVIVVDTSYSTSGELIHNFLKETYTILTEQNSFFAKSRIRIIQCDDQVRMDEEVKNSRELEQLLNRFTVIGGGGTDFRPAFAYVNELLEQGVLKNLGGLLYFTDGKGIYPKKRPEYKTAFLFLDDYDESAVPPWAMRLRVEQEDILAEETRRNHEH